MAINWETGKITGEQQKINSQQKHPFIEDMVKNQEAYILNEAIGLDREDHLWLAPEAIAYSEGKELNEFNNDELCRIIKTKKGYVLDVTHLKEFKLVTDTATDFKDEKWIQVKGIISSIKELAAFENIMFKNYSIMLGRSALNEPSKRGAKPT